VDGQHRIAALKIRGFGGDKVQCEIYENLTEAEEAELFLQRDDRKAITPFDKFRIALVAEREPEISVNAVVEAAGLKVSQGGNATTDRVQAVTALLTSYDEAGEEVLLRALLLLRQGFDGESKAFTAPMIRAMTQVVLRYGGALNEEVVVEKLLATRNGVRGIMRAAEAYKERLGRSPVDCFAAALVDAINSGRSRGKLESWWK
jgi:hypothetical protein